MLSYKAHAHTHTSLFIFLCFSFYNQSNKITASMSVWLLIFFGISCWFYQVEYQKLLINSNPALIIGYSTVLALLLAPYLCVRSKVEVGWFKMQTLKSFLFFFKMYTYCYHLCFWYVLLLNSKRCAALSLYHGIIEIFTRQKELWAFCREKSWFTASETQGLTHH